MNKSTMVLTFLLIGSAYVLGIEGYKKGSKRIVKPVDFNQLEIITQGDAERISTFRSNDKEYQIGLDKQGILRIHPYQSQE